MATHDDDSRTLIHEQIRHLANGAGFANSRLGVGMEPSLLGVEDDDALLTIRVLYLFDYAIGELVVRTDSVHGQDDVNTVGVAFKVLFNLVNTDERLPRLHGATHKRVLVCHCDELYWK